jgi:hypothetical protein
MTVDNVEHLIFIMNQPREGIILKDNEFMAMRCSKLSCRFSMTNPRVQDVGDKACWECLIRSLRFFILLAFMMNR